jgi:hypothetical protein
MKPQRHTTRIRHPTRHPITRMHTLTIQPKPALKSAPTVPNGNTHSVDISRQNANRRTRMRLSKKVHW